MGVAQLSACTAVSVCFAAYLNRAHAWSIVESQRQKVNLCETFFTIVLECFSACSGRYSLILIVFLSLEKRRFNR
jgi:hypothetical protein